METSGRRRPDCAGHQQRLSLYSIQLRGENEGKELWKVAMENRVDESVPAIYGERAYNVSADGNLYCFE